MLLEKYNNKLEDFLKNDGKGLFTIEQLQKGNTYKIVGHYHNDAKNILEHMREWVSPRSDKKQFCFFGWSGSAIGVVSAALDELVLVLSQPEIVALDDDIPEESDFYAKVIKVKLFLFGSGATVQEVLKVREDIILFKEVK